MKNSGVIVRRGDQKTSEWSGGSTTELAIYPEDAEYKKRNFKWRISTASMKSEESTFTPLPGYWRLLMATGGEFTLQHRDRHETRLKPFEQDQFSGAWTTLCSGCGEDLNLMLAAGYRGELKAVPIADFFLETLHYDDETRSSEVYECLYAVEGAVQVSIDRQAPVLLKRGDLFVYKKEIGAHQIHIQYEKVIGQLIRAVNVIRITIVDGGSAGCDSINESDRTFPVRLGLPSTNY